MKVAKDKDGKYISIEEAISSNTYYCICGGNEVTNKNQKQIELRQREIHFAHKGDCPGNEETYLHRVAKYIIENSNEIWFRELGKVTYISSEIEKPINGIIPDALLSSDHGLIAIEIYVTNKKGSNHITNYKENNVTAFEIQLNDLDYDSDFRVIRERVIIDIEHNTKLHIRGNETQPLNRTLEWWEDPFKLFVVFFIGILVLLGCRKK